MVLENVVMKLSQALLGVVFSAGVIFAGTAAAAQDNPRQRLPPLPGNSSPSVTGTCAARRVLRKCPA